MRSDRIPKPLERKIRDLDDNLYLLRHCLREHHHDRAFLKLIAVLMRSLACYSSGTEGLLWRLAEKLRVSDEIELEILGDAAGPVHLRDKLVFSYSDIHRPGHGLSRGFSRAYSLKQIIKERKTTVAGGEPLTHEALIKHVAQQLGAAHEAEGVSSEIAALEQVRIGGRVPYVAALVRDAELILQIGERVLVTAESKTAFQRRPREPGYGDLTIALLVEISSEFSGPILLYSLGSWVSEVEIQIGTGLKDWRVLRHRRETGTREVACGYPFEMVGRGPQLLALEYSSRSRTSRFSINGEVLAEHKLLDFGWVHAHELTRVRRNVEEDGPVWAERPRVFPGHLGADRLSELADRWRGELHG